MRKERTESEKRLKSIDNNLRFLTWLVILYLIKIVMEALNPIFNIY